MTKDPIYKLLESMLNDAYDNKNKKTLREALNKEFAVTYRSIPEIRISELGWGNIETPVEGQETTITENDRYILESYLKNIKGSTFEEKLGYINSLFSMSPEQLEESDMIKSDKSSEKIQKAMSYLVFLKVMTSLLTDYNAASAAFAFESFLATLLGGEQIKVGSGTIADIKTTDNKPISLKLLTRDKPEILGSFSDLVEDLVEEKFPPHKGMTYVVGLKELTGKGKDLSGIINFSQFDITLENVFDIMRKQNLCIALPKEFITNEQFDISDIKNKEVSDEKILELFSKNLRMINNFKNFEGFEKFGFNSDEFEQIFNETFVNFNQETLDAIASRIEKIIFSGGFEEGVMFKAPKRSSSPVKLGYSEFKKEFLVNVLYKMLVDENAIPADFNYREKKPTKKVNLLMTMLVNYVEKASGAADTYRRSIVNPAEHRKTVLSISYTEDSELENVVKFYKNLSPERKKVALKNSRGYLVQEEWKLNGYSALMATPESNFKQIGQIKVGQANIQNLVDKLVNTIDLSVFEIFDNLKVMTYLINDYFANGMKDDNKASSIQLAARNIDNKTEQVKLKVNSEK